MSFVYYGSPIILGIGLVLVLFFTITTLLFGKCSECTARNTKNSTFCKNCGLNLTSQEEFSEEAIFSRKVIILSFFIPFLAIYMWINFRELYPSQSKLLGVMATVGTLVTGLNAYFAFLIGYFFLFYVF